MSDNLSKDSCEREMSAYLDFPTEVFTDIFKLLPCRTLVQCVQPVNKTFKAICDRNVKSIHVIKRAEEFFDKLEAGDPEANQHVEALSGHNCALAGQFVFDKKDSVWLYTNNAESQATRAVLRHSLDLFQQCRIKTLSKQRVSAEHLAYLTIFEPTKPCSINVHILKNSTIACLSTLLHRPTILNCSRLKLVEYARARAQDNCQPIFDWLHHNPVDMDLESSSIDVMEVDQQQQQLTDIRCLLCYCFNHNQFERVLERCVQNLQQSQNPSDRCHFVFAFIGLCSESSDELLDHFARTESPTTGEVLLLDHFVDDRGAPCYRLVRCLASQIANGTKQLYAKLFKPNGGFNIGDEQGKKPLKVMLEDKKLTAKQRAKLIRGLVNRNP